MTTIKEDYCSQDVYKLLKEKGFDGEIHTTFDKEGYTQPSITLQMAMKWLREKKNIFIDVYYEKDIKGYMYSIIKLTKGTILNVSDLADNSYEQACEAAIKYCLENLI